jgi:hypothetical protein
MSLGWHVREVETFTNANGEAIYHLVYVQPSGFVIVSADDLVEPIVGFVQGDRFDPSRENPLGALVMDDLSQRMAAVRTGSTVRIMAEESFERDTQTKWRHLIDLAEGAKDRVVATALGIPSISDVRVAPLVKSKWWQCTVSSCGPVTVQKCPLPCYNYYTPGNYPCGCAATALAQVMRYHEQPASGIGVRQFGISLTWGGAATQTVFTRGGDGLGGPYRWDLMPYEPNCATPEAERQAIGALCYDAGISMNQTYSANGSGWPGSTCDPIAKALTTTFTYTNAVHGYNSESPIGRGLVEMVNPNLDAKKPVILATIAHAFVCDGYGYDYATLYHHLNMGWSGIDDAWYDLNTSIGTSGGDMGIVCSCVYNVQTIQAGNGEIISGRVLDQNEEPIANAVLYAKSGSDIVAETKTDSHGIYAFDCLESNTAYTLNAVLRGYGFNRQKVATGISRDNSIVSANVWGVDFAGLLCDFNSDQKVDIEDLVMLIEHWGKDDPSFDIAPAPLGDGIVDLRDLEVLMDYWGQEVELPESGLVARWKLDEPNGDIAHESIHHRDGTLHGGPIWQRTGGRIGGTLQFDGTDDCVSTPPVLDPAAGAFSVFAWIKGGALGQVILSQDKGANWLMAGAPDGILTTEVKEPGRKGKPLVSQAIITDDAWHRVGLVWDGSNRVLYVDNVEVVKDTQANLPSSPGGLYIGAGTSLAPGTFWSGLIDDVRIYNRAVQP